MNVYKDKRGYMSLELVFGIFMIAVLIGAYMELSATEMRLLERHKDGIDDLNRIISVLESDIEGIAAGNFGSKEFTVFQDEHIEVKAERLSGAICVVEGVSKENKRIRLKTYVWIEE